MTIKNPEKNKVKIDTQTYAVPPIMPVKTKKKNDLTFRNTVIRGLPYNSYKNTRKKIKRKKKTNKKKAN